MRNRLFGLPRRILYEQFPYAKENYEHALDFALGLSHFFGLGEFRLSAYNSFSLRLTLV
jgi:hypothetical protein